MDESPPRRARRSSILKASRAPLSCLEDNEGYDEDRTTITRTATLRRRVSFSSTNKVQEFCNEADTIWGENYEKPMMPPDANAKLNSAPAGLESSKSFQSLLTGDIIHNPCAVNVSREIQFTYAESVTNSRTQHSQSIHPSQDDVEDEEMELTAPNAAIYSQGSQGSICSQGPSQVTVVDRQMPILMIDKENVTQRLFDGGSALDKTALSSLNMSLASQLDPDQTLPEDASYLASPKGFNTTRFSGLEDSDSTSDIMEMLKGGLDKSLRPYDKTLNESVGMDMTAFGKPNSKVTDEEEEKTEDLKAVTSMINGTCHGDTSIDEDSTLDMLKEEQAAESSVNTEDVVPTESVSSLSKHRKSISFNNPSMNTTSAMDISMFPMDKTSAPMEISLAAPRSSNEFEDLVPPETPKMDMTFAVPADMDQTTRQPLEMSVEERELRPAELVQEAANKSCRKSLNMTNYLVADLTIEKNMIDWNSAEATDTTKSLLGSAALDKTHLPSNAHAGTPPGDSSLNEIARGAPLKNLLMSPSLDENEIPIGTTAHTTLPSMEMSLIDEPIRNKTLDKTFDVPASVLDSTDFNVPDETLSDNVFASEEVQVQLTEVISNKSQKNIATVLQRIVDQVRDESFNTEDTKIVETTKDPQILDNPDARRYTQEEDFGEVHFGAGGHVSVNMKHTETTGMMVSPEQLSCKQVDLSCGQELIVSPNSKHLVTVRSRTLERPSPPCRNYNLPAIVFTSATSVEDDSEELAEFSPEEFRKQVQKSRRQPEDHSPAKKVCSDAAKEASRKSVSRNDLDQSRRNGHTGKRNFEEEFRRNHDFGASTSKVVDDCEISKRSEMDTSRRNRTFDFSEMSISFVPQEAEPKCQQSLLVDFENLEAILPKKKCTELDVLSRRMDEVILWYKKRKADSTKADQKAKKILNSEVVSEEVNMGVEEETAEVLTPVAANLKQIMKHNKYWKLVKDDRSVMEFSILNHSMVMAFILDENEYVDDIKFSTETHSVATVNEFCHRIFFNRISIDDLKKACKRKKDIPNLMKSLQPKLLSFTNLVISLQKASAKHILSFKGTKVTFRCYRRELLLVFDVSVDFAIWDKIKVEDIDTKSLIGNFNAQDVKDLVAYERKNENFLLKFIKSVEDLMSTKENLA